MQKVEKTGKGNGLRRASRKTAFSTMLEMKGTESFEILYCILY